MSDNNKIGMLEIIFGGLLISSLGLDLRSEREKLEEKAIDYDFKKRESLSKEIDKMLLSKKEWEKQTYDDERLKTCREELSQKEKNLLKINKYLHDPEYEELVVKIANFEKQKDWKKVIEYCNKYNKFILPRSWITMDKRVEYEFKKMQAYINLEQYRGAWNSICKTRNMIMSSFQLVECLNYLSKTEFQMERICLYKNCPIDALYHNIMAIVYKDIFDYYKSGKELDFKLEKSLKQILEKSNARELLESIENTIKVEYNNISEKTIRKINFRLVKILKDNNFRFTLEEPKKYYPKRVTRDFPVK